MGQLARYQLDGSIHPAVSPSHLTAPSSGAPVSGPAPARRPFWRLPRSGHPNREQGAAVSLNRGRGLWGCRGKGLRAHRATATRRGGMPDMEYLNVGDAEHGEPESAFGFGEEPAHFGASASSPAKKEKGRGSFSNWGRATSVRSLPWLAHHHRACARAHAHHTRSLLLGLPPQALACASELFPPNGCLSVRPRYEMNRCVHTFIPLNDLCRPFCPHPPLS